MASGSFKQQNSYESRVEVSSKIRSQYPDRVPVIVERDARARIADIEKKKFLVPAEISVAKFISEIRNHIRLSGQESLFVFTGVDSNVMPQPNSSMSVVYNQHADPDGFLYIVYSSENTFG